MSRHRNLVGFNVDVAQLLRVLRAAGANVPESLELKLQQLGGRSQQAAPDAALGHSKPFLTVSSKGQVLDIQQDLPISTPLRPSGAAGLRAKPMVKTGDARLSGAARLTWDVRARDRCHHGGHRSSRR